MKLVGECLQQLLFLAIVVVGAGVVGMSVLLMVVAVGTPLGIDLTSWSDLSWPQVVYGASALLAVGVVTYKLLPKGVTYLADAIEAVGERVPWLLPATPDPLGWIAGTATLAVLVGIWKLVRLWPWEERPSEWLAVVITGCIAIPIIWAGRRKDLERFAAPSSDQTERVG